MSEEFVGDSQTTPEQLARLEILHEEFKKLPKDGRFFMEYWLADLERADYDEIKEGYNKALENPCGTAGCIVGKAGFIPRIRDLGFKITLEPFDERLYFTDEINETCISTKGLGAACDESEENPLISFWGYDAFSELFTSSKAIDNIFNIEQATKAIAALILYIKGELTYTAYNNFLESFEQPEDIYAYYAEYDR